MLEGDALEVVQALNRYEGNWGSYGQLIIDVKEMLSHSPMWCIRHTNCIANGVAHKLAKLALEMSENYMKRPKFYR